ncbi:MAG: hypothetical protein WC309_00930 [Candidatus Paceibacterota bacterium]|jgi:hypothetical protein
MPSLIVPTLFGQRRYELFPFNPSDLKDGYRFKGWGFSCKMAWLDARRIKRKGRLPRGVRRLVIVGTRKIYYIYASKQGGLRVASFSLYFRLKDFHPTHIAYLPDRQLSARIGMDGDGP